jgi:manganese transport protein
MSVSNRHAQNTPRAGPPPLQLQIILKSNSVRCAMQQNQGGMLNKADDTTGFEAQGGGEGWRRARGEAPLSDVYRTISVKGAGSARRLAAFLGPGYLVAVGYMDPGNWATSLAGGSKFGYTLLCVALISNIMAIVLQALCARLAIASGRDLAQACRDAYPRWAAWPLWLAAEVAIIATDIAEVIGTAIGLNLLFGIPLEIGVLLTALDVFLILYLQRIGFRYLEALIITLLGVIAACFAIQIALADPQWGPLIRGFAPTVEIVRNPEMLYLAMGILGATVMPHNLYLHSAIVQTRAYGHTTPEKREALKFATIDSTVALMFALLINASILILAAASFHKIGRTDVAELGQAQALLHPLLGSAIAPTLFGIALLCCGLNSTVTATLAGQAVMEGFLDIRLPPWLRRLVTRAIAIIPAAGVTLFYGEQETGKLLILSQVILSLQLPFAVVPLVQFTANRAKMGVLVAPRWLVAFATLIAVTIIALNAKLIWDQLLG